MTIKNIIVILFFIVIFFVPFKTNASLTQLYSGNGGQYKAGFVASSSIAFSISDVTINRICKYANYSSGYVYIVVYTGFSASGPSNPIATSSLNNVADLNYYVSSTDCYNDNTSVDTFHFDNTHLTAGTYYFDIKTSENYNYTVIMPADTVKDTFFNKYTFSYFSGTGYWTGPEIPFISADLYYISNVEIIELTPFVGNVSVGSEQLLDPVSYTTCTTGLSCLLWFGYGYTSIDKDVYLLNDVDGQRDPAFSHYAPRTLINGQILKDYFLLDDEVAPATKNYCLFLENDATSTMYCGVVINWVTENIEQITVDWATICDDVATSSVEWWDPTSYAGAIRYGLECGARKFFYWLVVYSSDSKTYFDRSVNKLKITFPANSYFSLIDAINGAIATTTVSNNATIGMPWIEKTATGSNYYILPLISSTSMTNALGAENTANYRLYITYFLWIVNALAIAFIGWKVLF